MEKVTGKKTLWQFIKFIFVGLLATIVQFASVNILYLMPFIKSLYGVPFSWFVFDYPAASKGLGMFIAFNTANVLAQIVAFFVNRDKTFGSSANIAVTLPIYIVFTIALICFSAWLAPALQAWFISMGLSGTASINISTAVCSAVQFFLYFPVDKILFREKKSKNEENVSISAD